MKIGLFFGSFNPVHIGHMIIANFMATQTDLDKVWMVVSPQNPLKEKKSLMKDYLRLDLVNMAIGENPRLWACDIEFHLPKPSYTIDTLIYLEEKYPGHEFCLIMGSDNLQTIEKWKNYQILLANYSLYIYQRPGWDGNLPKGAKEILTFNAPLMNISSTYIRGCIDRGFSIEYLVPDPVFKYFQG